MTRSPILLTALVVAMLTIPATAQKINFGPDGELDSATYPEFSGYLGDDGSAFGDRGNGYSYGWMNGALEPDPQAASRNRNNDGWQTS